MSTLPHARTPDRTPRFAAFAAVAGLLLTASPLSAWQNILQDPGFERYHYDAAAGRYVPDANAAWTELGFGQASVRYDFSGWNAPAEMIAERALGFTPGAGGFEGTGPTQNKGQLAFQQDFVGSTVLNSGTHYEAWVWLGGAGLDDDTGLESKDESGGWQIYFYSDPNPANWQESNAIEYHHALMDYWGQPAGFRRVSGYGRIPVGAVGFRFRAVASSWAPASGGGNHNTRVALDNAHFAMIATPNLLTNGDFEQESYFREFYGWNRPAVYPFPRNGLAPQNIADFGGLAYAPFRGGAWSYGYYTYFSGWQDDAFTFSQEVAYTAPQGTPVDLMWYWWQDTMNRDGRWQFRYDTSQVQCVVQFLDGAGQVLGTQDIWMHWPWASNPANSNAYDQNGDVAYNPRHSLVPPAGTARIRLNVNNMVYCPYNPAWYHVKIAIDNFYLNYADQTPQMFLHKLDQITYRSARVRWLTDAYTPSRADYGTTIAYGLEAADPTPTTAHTIFLTGLKPGRRYYYREQSGLSRYPLPGNEASVYVDIPALGDFDRDGDVDMTDFGVFQRCLSGADVPQTLTECAWTKLDTDTDVDAADLEIMLACVSGPGVPLDPDCAE